MSTIDERVTALENEMDEVSPGWRDPIIIDPDKPKPTYEGTVTSALTEDFFIFNPAIIINSKWVCFAMKGGRIYKGISDNGLNDWVWLLTDCKYGSIIYGLIDGEYKYRCSYHKWNVSVQGYCTSYFAGSSDGVSWSDMSVDWSQTCGEDRNMILDIKLKNYIRVKPSPQIRTIGYTESINGGYAWTPITEILTPSILDPAGTQFYEMSVIKTTRGYFGLLNVYDSLHGLIDLQLTFSIDGKNMWQRLNGRHNFFERKDGIKQMFGNWSIVGDTVYIYTIENTHDHESGGVHFSSRYKISLTDLYKYLE